MIPPVATGGPAVWVLNLDAEIELGARGRYQPTDATRAQVVEARSRARAVMGPGEVAIEEVSRADGRPGKAWCMTDSARAALIRKGSEPVPSPPVSVLRTVNDRAFCAGLGQVLEGAVFVTDEDAFLGRLHVSNQPLLAKRAFGVAGRGQRRFLAGRVSGSDLAWIRASLRMGGVQLEPLLPLRLELSTHGEVAPDGRVRLGRPCVQECTPSGVWQRTRPLATGELSGPQEQAMVTEAARVGEALHAAGYFGPYGVDGYLYGEPARLSPRSEINARYTMGWAVSFPPAASPSTP
jgi:hypothetical protein